VGANLLANQLKNFDFNSLATILEKIVSLLASATQSASQSPSQNVGRCFPTSSNPVSQPSTNNSTGSSGSQLDKARSWADPSSDSFNKSAIPNTAGGPHLVNNGGKVLSNPDINNIYVGSYFTTAQGQQDVAYNDAATKNWVTSGNEAILSQY